MYHNAQMLIKSIDNDAFVHATPIV